MIEEDFRGIWGVGAGNDFCVYDHISACTNIKFPKNKKIEKIKQLNINLDQMKNTQINLSKNLNIGQ